MLHCVPYKTCFVHKSLNVDFAQNDFWYICAYFRPLYTFPHPNLVVFGDPFPPIKKRGVVEGVF